MNLTPNLQTRSEDIRNNPELWIQKISVILFTDENGKPYWTKEYKFIPNHQRYNQAVKWIRDTKFEEYNCRIVQNANNEIEIITRNYFGPKASLEQEEKEVLSKIRKKLGEEIRKEDEELVEELDYELDIEIEEEAIEILKDWTQLGFTPQQKQDWLNIGLAEEDGEFAAWLKTKKLSPEEVLNHGNERELREEHERTPKQTKEPTLSSEQKKEVEEYRKSLTNLGKSKQVEEFLESEFREIYEEEAEELERIISQKEQEGESGISYDLGRPDLAILWRKQLYFVSGFEYTNNWKLTVSIRAKKCLLGMYYWNWMRGGGMGTLIKGPIQSENTKMHYDFCSDLSIKATHEQAFGYQPRFALFKVRDSGLDLTFSKGKDGSGINIPTNVTMDVWDSEHLNDILKKAKEEAEKEGIEVKEFLEKYAAKEENEDEKGKKISKSRDLVPPVYIDFLGALFNRKFFLVVGCEEQAKLISSDPNEGRKGLFSHSEERKEILFTNDPQMAEWVKKQPHLRTSVTFQFYLFQNIITPANWEFLGIIAEDEQGNELKNWDQEPEKVKNFVLPYKLWISSSPANLHYRWEFKYINVKLDISTQGKFEPSFSLSKVLRSLSVNILGTGGSVSWDPDGNNPLSKKQLDQTSKQEQQTERMFKSTLKDPLGKTIEPAVFNSNTIDFNYSLGEFFNRLTSPIFFYRVHASELLYNRLKWANNKQKMLNLPVQWPAYGEFAQKLGYWKWNEVNLESDINGFFTQRMLNGYYLTDGSKLNKPDFDYDKGNNYLQSAGNAWDIYFAEEIKKTITETIEVQKTDHADSYDNITKHDNMVLFTSPPYIRNENGQDVLLGLLQQTPNWRGGGGYAGWNYGGEWSKEFTIPAGKYSYFWKVWTGPEKNGELDSKSPIKVKLHMRAGGGKGTGDGTVDIDFEWIQAETRTRTITTFGETKKTKTQEIDQSELESRENENETIEEQELDLNEIEREKPEQGIGERSQELAQEKEREAEKEQEFEKEKEQETEKEDEKETEQEKEKEAETAQEQTQEQEKPKEQEQENEEEEEFEEEEEIEEL